jgi:hypothetical protein
MIDTMRDVGVDHGDFGVFSGRKIFEGTFQGVDQGLEQCKLALDLAVADGLALSVGIHAVINNI